jgi:hypothetical protein
MYVIKTSKDSISANNLCFIDQNKLEDIKIQDMIPGQIMTGRIIWLTTISHSAIIQGVILIAKDDNEAPISLTLYNMIKTKIQFKKL